MFNLCLFISNANQGLKQNTDILQFIPDRFLKPVRYSLKIKKLYIQPLIRISNNKDDKPNLRQLNLNFKICQFTVKKIAFTNYQITTFSFSGNLILLPSLILKVL
jgi:hypothetical protein